MRGGGGEVNLSIIIPMLNESAQLPDLFAHMPPTCWRSSCWR
jgi:hypothetical protein